MYRQGIITLPRISLFDALLFLYFVTLHADQLSSTLFGFTIRLNNFIAAILLLSVLFATKKKEFFLKKSDGFACLFVTAALLLSSLTSNYFSRSMVFFAWYLISVLFYFFLPIFLLQLMPLMRLLKIYFLSFLIVGAYAFFQFAFSLLGFLDPFAEQKMGAIALRPNAFAYEPSYFALYMTPFVMIANLHFILKNVKPTLPILAILGINGVYVLSSSSSVFFAYLFLFLFSLCFEETRKPILKYGCYFLATIAPFSLLFPKFFKDFFLKFFFHGFMEHHSFFERWVGIKNAWSVFLHNPWKGVGLGGIPPYLCDAWCQKRENFVFLVSREQVISSPNPLKFFEPMNVTTELLGCCGLIGFAAFALCFGLYIAKVKRALQLKDVKSYLVLLFFISTLVMLALLQFNQGLFRTYVIVHLALAVGIMAEKEEDLYHIWA